MMRPLTILLVSAVGAHAAVIAADSARGARLFETLSCIQCHSVNGKGGRTGPDLGRLVDRNFTPASLAATMWNHAPTMWALMRERSIPLGHLDEQAAADLFAYFYSARFFEKPGDAGRGKRLFSDLRCAQCHGLNSPVRPGVRPVSEWTSMNAPFGLAAAMWNHRASMQAAAAETRMRLPELSEQDLSDLLVYVRNLPGTREQGGKFETTSGADGEALFRSKGCIACHRAGSELGRRIKGDTLTEIAAAMWNHAPKMAAAGAPPAHFEPAEMRELLSYLWAKQFFEDAGDAGRGKRVFTEKRCSSCHGAAGSNAPRIVGAGARFSGPSMVSALWRHGPAMLEQMKVKGVPWPRFDGHEMTNLIAYLDSGSANQ